jgi:hypothetical protein
LDLGKYEKVIWKKNPEWVEGKSSGEPGWEVIPLCIFRGLGHVHRWNGGRITQIPIAAPL